MTSGIKVMLDKLLHPFSLSLLALVPILALRGDLSQFTARVLAARNANTQSALARRAPEPAANSALPTPAPASSEPTSAPLSLDYPPPLEPTTAAPASPSIPSAAIAGENSPLQTMDNTPRAGKEVAAAQPVLDRLRALGVRYLRIERDEAAAGALSYCCYCELPRQSATGGVRAFQATGSDASLAASRVLSQIETLGP